MPKTPPGIDLGENCVRLQALRVRIGYGPREKDDCVSVRPRPGRTNVRSNHLPSETRIPCRTHVAPPTCPTPRVGHWYAAFRTGTSCWSASGPCQDPIKVRLPHPILTEYAVYPLGLRCTTPFFKFFILNRHLMTGATVIYLLQLAFVSFAATASLHTSPSVPETDRAPKRRWVDPW